MTTPKNNAPTVQKVANEASSSSLTKIFAALAIVVALASGYLIYIFILGSPANFEGGDPYAGHPHNMLGTIHKGGIAIVPILIALNILVILIAIERFITLQKTSGKASAASFIKNIRTYLSNNKIDEAMAACDEQQGSLANVVKTGLGRYAVLNADNHLDKNAKVAALEKELEEATSLELPMMSKNMSILSTSASIGTLVGLIGTVIGMIKAFSALANAGAPDTAALAIGISEALINTALGIICSTLAIIAYNVFTNKIDAMTYSMDEAGYSIVGQFQAQKNN
jgi:biopolymer transport protein ExbB